MHGNVKTALLYQLSIVGSALSFVALGASQRSLVGCSGGVYCLLGAHMSEILFFCQPDPQHARGEGWKLRLCRGLLLVGAAVAIAYLSAGSAEDSSSNGEVASAWQAHAGGFITGLLGSSLFFRWSLEEYSTTDDASQSFLRDRVVTPLIASFLVVFFGATLWETYNTDGAFPPEGLFSSLEPSSESCCSQVLGCSNGLATVDYSGLMCDGAYDISAPSGKPLKTCAEMSEYVSSQ